jgi:hypothetical protein
MKRSRDPLTLSPHWHVDCRIEAELPEDNIVGTRFLINFVFTAVAFAALLFTGWLGYVNLSLRSQIRDWEQRIKDNNAEVREIQKMQRDYAAASAKIDQAYNLVRPQLFVSDFIAHIGKTRPEEMAIDIIEWNDLGIVIRGSFVEKSERATPERAFRVVGGYVEQLKKDPKMAPLFRDIGLTDIDRGTTGSNLKFEIVFRLKAART